MNALKRTALGEVVTHRGLLREAEAKALRAQERQGMQASGDGEGEAQPTAPGISEKLARRLSAHRTAALQAEFAAIRTWLWWPWCIASRCV